MYSFFYKLFSGLHIIPPKNECPSLDNNAQPMTIGDNVWLVWWKRVNPPLAQITFFTDNINCIENGCYEKLGAKMVAPMSSIQDK